MSPAATDDSKKPAVKTEAVKPEVKAEAVKPKAAAKKKTTTTKKVDTPAEARRKNAEIARKVIKDKTKQTAIKPSYSTYPHIPSGSFAINDLIGGSMALDGKGQVCPGYPRRRLTEIFGPESSGKTTVALHAVVEVQQAGGLAMFLDFEHALDHAYAKKIGVSFDEDKLLLYAPDTFEEGLQIINIGLQAGVDLIVVDSVPSMVPKEDMEGKIDKEGRFGNLARALAKNLPKLVSWLNQDRYLARNKQGAAIIFLNQQRANIGGSKNNPTKTTGGYAMKFYTSLRLQFTGVSKEYVKRKNRLSGVMVSVPYGTNTRAKVVKNKIDAKQGATHTIFIRFGTGIDEVYSLIIAACHWGVIKKGGGGQYQYGGTTFKGRDKLRKFLLENPKVFKEIRKVLLSLVQGEAEDLEPEEDLTEEEILARSFDEEFGEEAGSEVELDDSEVELDSPDEPDDG